MTTLRTTYGLNQGSLIVAKVKATNLIGDSDYSEPNINGALIEIEPHTMTIPELGSALSLT